jgi:hypothetical protein
LVRATQTRPRCPNADGNLCTAPDERPRAPAIADARAPPGPVGHARPIATVYPPLPLAPVAAREFLTWPRAPVSRISVVPLVAISRWVVCTIKWMLMQVGLTEATIAAERGGCVARDTKRRFKKKGG